MKYSVYESTWAVGREPPLFESESANAATDFAMKAGPKSVIAVLCNPETYKIDALSWPDNTNAAK